jgi:hypothetical protein
MRIIPGQQKKPLFFFILSGLLILFLGLTSCAVEPELPLATLTATETPAPPTATIVWFPVTDTPTPLPTKEKIPTLEQRPGIGELVLSENFNVETRWQTSRTETGNMAFGKNVLTLAVASSKRGLQSFFSQTIPADSYLEIIANPSLCRNRDTYGLLLRAQSDNSYYRYVVACTGELRLERYRNGEMAVLQDWMPSGQVPPGAPISIRLGVWMKDKELRFFINDSYQFTVIDPVYPSGQLGVFARTADQPPLTVSFSDLKVYDLE